MDGPGDILRVAAARFGGKTALVTATRTLSFTELDALSDRVAAWLAARGVRPGQVVSLYAQNRWEWVVTAHGALKAGAVINPVNVMLTPEELAFVLRDCGSAAVFTSAEQAGTVVELTRDLPELGTVVAFGEAEGAVGFDEVLACTDPVPEVVTDPAAPSTIGYTSGTTGHPKGAVQSHRAVLWNCATTATVHGRHAGDVVVTALPAPHVYGNVAINGTFLAGGTVVLMERFSPGEALRLIGEHRATLFEGVPAMYAMLLADPGLADADLSSLTRCTVGGQTISLSTIERWESRSGAPLIELWGMTEIAGLGTTHPLHAPPVPGSIGVSLPGVQVRIADLEDVRRDAAPGVPGELMVRGPIVMIGYHGNPTATAEAIEPDGWLHTGDVATMDETGHVFVVDRRKDMIITGGYNVYPAEVERVLAGHPAVAMVAVGPVPDPVRGELACAYVVPAAGTSPTEEELIAHTAGHLAAYKRPRLVRFVDALPATSTGKIMRRELIKQFTP
ncbi:AMP-binding protein [Pseudonocardia sp. KRD-184]|uniref:AMP-binding protein n=1 Tax=Pseudonocardia oceani TaxID=2792013 RepID=A0ABS6U8P2_9PSEU|nr:AMP-binding protein [Pseudonocardia oceani]MBW0089351.1 AMP-binding protein [Pseudonocardia oceani]MBW0095940.1 AMP-binding protein [Pseudonocardia oceani]MBW0108647.1 AMP-binding protein [Pseudonocardia oceani]MBW0122775.1 AMP-binding protein [Pseudonocardia oceani]MBW0128617.1 AMP-binding protein [Pseudonocardia oceani]